MTPAFCIENGKCAGTTFLVKSCGSVDVVGPSCHRSRCGNQLWSSRTSFFCESAKSRNLWMHVTSGARLPVTVDLNDRSHDTGRLKEWRRIRDGRVRACALTRRASMIRRMLSVSFGTPNTPLTTLGCKVNSTIPMANIRRINFTYSFGLA